MPGTSIVEDDMNQGPVMRSERVAKVLRSLAIGTSLLLLPPFFALAIAPMLLVLVPVAIVGLPFIIPAMFPSSLQALTEERQASLRPSPRPVLVLR